MFKFIHASDLHLDSPLHGLDFYDGAPVEDIRGATRRALKELVELAVDEHVAFVLIAGDLYDGDWRDYNTGLYFSRQMSRLREAGIKVFIVAGNHDAASQITKNLRMPDNVRILPSDRPDTVTLESLGAAIHGRSFPTKAVTQDLSCQYPPPLSGYFNIGLLHTSVNGREEHEPYAPCQLEGLISKGYDYWALGHVHKREILSDEPWVVFCGNLQGRHVRETGAKGCSLVTVEGNRVASVEHREVDVVRWDVCELPVLSTDDGDGIVDRLGTFLPKHLESCKGRPLAMRVHITGACRAHRLLVTEPDRWRSEIKARCTDASDGRIWIERIDFDTRPAEHFEELAARADALGGLLTALAAIGSDEPFLADLREDLSDLYRKLPSELRQGDEAIDLNDPTLLGRAVEDVKQLLLSRLLGNPT